MASVLYGSAGFAQAKSQVFNQSWDVCSRLLVAKRNNTQIALLCPRKPAFDDTRGAPPQYYAHSLRAQLCIEKRSISLSWISSGAKRDLMGT
ncbi:MAG: hypothetical protein DMG76_13115 [Acidobacteria bacterium]|nr:MAG: hypothetical protein DMG76_13115 [Acidobacteriota bacterium]